MRPTLSPADSGETGRESDGGGASFTPPGFAIKAFYFANKIRSMIKALLHAPHLKIDVCKYILMCMYVHCCNVCGFKVFLLEFSEFFNRFLIGFSSGDKQVYG